MNVLIADRQRVAALLPVDEAVAVMRRALAVLAGGRHCGSAAGE